MEQWDFWGYFPLPFCWPDARVRSRWAMSAVRCMSTKRRASAASSLSSYIGAGKWQLDGNTLLIRDTVISWDVKENYFAVDGNDLVFLAGESDNFTHLTVSDGERFVGHPMEEYFPTKSE